MASAYFTLPSFARAKKHQQELEKQNPQNPVLKDEDEKFLEREISRGETASVVENAEPSKISDDGEEKTATKADQAEAGGNQIAIPEEVPQTGNGAGVSSQDPSIETADQARKNKKNDFDLPSQEDAEAATHNLVDGSKAAGSKSPEQSGDKRTWTSYLPASMTSSFTKKGDSPSSDKPSDQATESPDQRTWKEYASSYVPLLPNLLSKDKDADVEPVYNADGTVDEEATKLKQEREVSVLLDNLNLSSINNRVFAFSGETQKIYDRFALVLKDTMNGGPTAYDDMEKLMKEAGPQLEKQFKSMPPFVQTLVKSLPAKLGATLAPELLAAASEKPGADLKIKQQASSSSTEAAAGTESSKKKKKRRIPSLKSLIGKQGAVAGILRSVVSFLRLRFPLLASGTNVVMSLAVFILMFVFWYCHKRGKESRLAREAEAGKVEGDEEDGDFDESDSDEGKDVVGEPGNDKADILNQKSPSEVPLPGNDEKSETK